MVLDLAEAESRALKFAERAAREGETLSPPPLPQRRSNGTGPFWAGVLAASVLAAYLSGLYTTEGVIRAWLTASGRDIYKEECFSWMPKWVNLAFRPPVDCSMCRDIVEVEKVEKITPKMFEERYAYSGRPVVVKDAMIDWTAPEVFSYEFFKKLYQDSAKISKCQFFAYETEFKSLQEVFNMSSQRAELKGSPWYVGWSNCDEKTARVLRAHYDRPYFLPEFAENKNIDWIFMGSPGYGAQLHVDDVSYPSWQAQLVGSKKWILEPPPECYFQCQNMEVVVNPGEIIVLDTNRWYHKTLIVSSGISITIGAEYD